MDPHYASTLALCYVNNACAALFSPPARQNIFAFTRLFCHARGGMALVDKTSAIADLLNYDAPDVQRIFFARPRKFGKLLTLSIAGEMLAAGALPEGVSPWSGFAPVDVPGLFGGLQVHKRLLAGDVSLRGLLQRPHFVVKLGLGGAQTGAELKPSIIRGLASIAGKAFGPALGAEVNSVVTPADALCVLVDAVPSAVPVALLVDERRCYHPGRD